MLKINRKKRKHGKNLQARFRLKELFLLLIVFSAFCVGSISYTANTGGETDLSTFLPAILSLLCFLLGHAYLSVFMPSSDEIMLPLSYMLVSFSLLMLNRLNSSMAQTQLIWLLVAICFFIILCEILRRKGFWWLDRYRYTFAAAGILLIASTMIIGTEINGARRWIIMGSFSFQPGEIAKIFLIIFFAAYLADNREMLSGTASKLGGIRIPHIKHMGPVMVIWISSLLIMIFERDLGSSLIFFGIFIGMLYIATGRILFVTTAFILFFSGSVVSLSLFPHVQNRIDAWKGALNPELVHNVSYQISQSLFSIADGGIAGRGLGRGHPYLIPFVETDFIFSSVSEELGLLGAFSIIMIFMLISSRIFFTALSCREDFGKLLISGLGLSFAVQAFVLLAGTTRMMPMTGVTLPLVSYGGSSLLSSFLLLSIVISISWYNSIKIAGLESKT